MHSNIYWMQDESSSERNIIVNGIVDFNGSPHKNKKAYSVDLVYTPGTHNYDSQIGINIFSLPVEKYTIIMEYFWPENGGISLSCESSTAVLKKQTCKKKHFQLYKNTCAICSKEQRYTRLFVF